MMQQRPTAPTMNEDRAAYIEAIQTFRLPRYDEFPAIDLYMDQVLGYIDEITQPLLVAGDKPLTSSMVNNYVKQGVIPRPQAKKYGRDHVAYLVVVSILKPCFSISEIAQLIHIQIDTTSSAQAYDSFCVAFEKILHRAFKDADGGSGGSDGTTNPSTLVTSDRVIPEEERDYPLRLMFSTAVSVTSRLYVAKMLEFEREN